MSENNEGQAVADDAAPPTPAARPPRSLNYAPPTLGYATASTGAGRQRKANPSVVRFVCGMMLALPGFLPLLLYDQVYVAYLWLLTLFVPANMLFYDRTRSVGAGWLITTVLTFILLVLVH